MEAKEAPMEVIRKMCWVELQRCRTSSKRLVVRNRHLLQRRPLPTRNLTVHLSQTSIMCLVGWNRQLLIYSSSNRNANMMPLRLMCHNTSQSDKASRFRLRSLISIINLAQWVRLMQLILALLSQLTCPWKTSRCSFSKWLVKWREKYSLAANQWTSFGKLSTSKQDV